MIAIILNYELILIRRIKAWVMQGGKNEKIYNYFRIDYLSDYLEL